MTATAGLRTGSTAVSPWLTTVRTAAALAASMGIGRFVFTPILPLMTAQAGLSPQLGSGLATANYVGYLIGAAAGIAVPALVRSRRVLRVSLVVLVGTLALMPVTTVAGVWLTLRLLAGVTSALIFMIVISAAMAHLRGPSQHLVGWSFGGVGAGIALSGVLVLVLRTVAGWQAAWWASAALTLVFAVPSWTLRVETSTPASAGDDSPPRTHRWFWSLFAAYTLEGVGYIIAGTFLVAAIDQTASGWVGSGAWVLVGLAALPSCAFWAWLAHRWSRPSLLLVALLVQAVGVAMPAVFDTVGTALVAAVLFGATFLGIASMSLAIGAHLRFPRAVAILTTGYGVGQIAGPLVVTPVLHEGYQPALLVGAAIVLVAAGAAVVLRIGFPQEGR